MGWGGGCSSEGTKTLFVGVGLLTQFAGMGGGGGGCYRSGGTKTCLLGSGL